MKPGKYRATLGCLQWLAFVFEDVETGDTLVRFDGIDRVNRLDDLYCKPQFHWLGRLAA